MGRSEDSARRATAMLTNSAHSIDAAPEDVFPILRRFDALRSLRDAVEALGLKDVVTLQHSGLTRDEGGVAAELSATWAIPGGGQARVKWLVSAAPSAMRRTLLHVCAEAETDVGNDPRMSNAWPILGPIIEAQSARIVRYVVELSESEELDAQEPLEGFHL